MAATKRILILLFCITAVYGSFAQVTPVQGSASNLRKKKLAMASPLQIDSLSIVPGTIRITGIPESDYRIDAINAIIHWYRVPQMDSIDLVYRVFSMKLNVASQRLNYDSIVNYTVPFSFGKDASDGKPTELFDFGTLRYNGSFGRSIAFGNSQDAVVNSNLNLQLNGMLGDSIEVAAAITDNNIPIQPDGSTQQLNEFDQVFLQFRKSNWQLNLGDIDIRQTQNYFLNFYKRLQGVSFKADTRIAPNVESHSLFSGSIAKGKFTRNIIEGLEGNQGPYRLTGANNEFFFIVLANTERVFIDGELLQRGEDQDYVINYNTAEITFTPRRMITKDSRIQVEFEYADRNYLNANFYVSQDFDFGEKLKLRLGAFHNSDAKNSQINQVLDANQRMFLGTVGDSIQNAFYPTAVIDTFAAGKILYEKIYNPAPGIDSAYRYSTDPALARYSLSFIEVGQGRGNYVPDFNGANGKVFRFVDPVGGVPQGSYEPVAILVTPKKQQIITIGTDYSISDRTLVSADLAMSNYDVNTFSSVHDGDDAGIAGKLKLAHLSKISEKLNLQTQFDYEHVQSKFRPLERLRYVEFTRDWGLPVITGPATENLLRASASLRNKSNQDITYQFMHYNRSDGYSGVQNVIKQSTDWKGWVMNNQFMITNFNDRLRSGYFLRPIIDISKQLKRLDSFRLGLRYTLEQNKIESKSSKELDPFSFSFDTYTLYFRSDPSKLNRYGITFFTRSDLYPWMGELVRGDRSYNLNFTTELTRSEKHQVFMNTTFRKLEVYNNNASRQSPDETILSRVEYLVNEFRGFLTGNMLYELGTGQEQRRDFVYLEVPAGQGNYTWIDYNEDSVQQLNEFEIALFQDQAKFIRIFTPTNDFVKANYLTFNYSIGLHPRALLAGSGSGKFASFLGKFNLQSSLQTSRKSVAKGGLEANPFKYGLEDTALITLNTILLNTISFNRFHSTWGLDFTNLRNSGKSLLTYGYESRRLNDWILKLRLTLSRSFSFDLTGKIGENDLLTPAFNNRNYELQIRNLEPRVVFIRGTLFRLSTSYKYDIRENLEEWGGEKAVSHSVNIETKYNVLQNSSISGRFTFNSIDYNGIPNTAVSYVMLDGLLPGENLLWSVEFTKRLLKNLELNFQYDGRKPGNSRTVHVGRAAIRALF